MYGMPYNYQAIIENSRIKWLDTPSPEAKAKAKVIVTVLAPVQTNSLVSANSNPKKCKLGLIQGGMTLPDDINWGDKQIQNLFAQN